MAAGQAVSLSSVEDTYVCTALVTGLAIGFVLVAVVGRLLIMQGRCKAQVHVRIADY